MFNYNPNSTNNSIQLINNYTNCLAKTMYVEGCVCHSCTVTDLDIDHVGNVARLRSIGSRASSNIQCLLRSYDQWSIGRVWTRVRLPATHSDTHTHIHSAVHFRLLECGYLARTCTSGIHSQHGAACTCAVGGALYVIISSPFRVIVSLSPRISSRSAPGWYL